MKYFHRTHLPPDDVLAAGREFFGGQAGARWRSSPAGGSSPAPWGSVIGDGRRPRAATTPW